MMVHPDNTPESRQVLSYSRINRPHLSTHRRTWSEKRKCPIKGCRRVTTVWFVMVDGPYGTYSVTENVYCLHCGCGFSERSWERVIERRRW